MVDCFKTLKQEWPKVKTAPYSFIMCIVVGVIIGGGAILFLYSYFVLPGKDGQIDFLKLEKDSLQSRLQEALIAEPKQVLNTKIDIKQEIRDLLDLINPKILPVLDKIYEIDPDNNNSVKIDEDGERYVRVFISPRNQNKLWNLSENPGFNKFLSYTQCDKFSYDPAWDPRHAGKGYIFDLDRTAIMRGYDFKPKDRLRK